MLRVIFGPKRGEEAGEWRKLHNNGLYDLSSLTIIWVITQEELDGQGMWHVWRGGDMRTGVWWGNLRGKRPFGRRKRRWEDNIKK